jgi:outer membrane lipoprotein SlyB
MRKILFAVAAATLTVPALPTAAVAAHDGYSQRASGYNGATWRGRDGRLRCRRSNGTVGLVVGGAGGALVGRALDGGRSRTTGTILGAAVGALVGREVQRSRSVRRCR